LSVKTWGIKKITWGNISIDRESCKAAKKETGQFIGERRQAAWKKYIGNKKEVTGTMPHLADDKNTMGL